MNFNRRNIAYHLRQHRKQQGLTQKQLAFFLDVDLKTYQKLESLNKEENVNFNLFIKTLDYLGLNVNIFQPNVSDRLLQIFEEDGDEKDVNLKIIDY